MRILLLTTGSARDIRTWSGTSYHIHQELVRRHHDVACVEAGLVEKLIMLTRKVLAKLGLDIYREDLVARVFNRLLSRQISRNKPDLIVGVAVSHKLARLCTRVPIVHISDATFAAMRNYYPRNFLSLSRRSVVAGDALERRVLENSQAVLLSSSWAAQSAIHDYATSPDKVMVAQFGANVDDPDASQPDIVTRLDKVSLLFIGVDWERKGGPLAFALLRRLAARQIDCTLHVVGCTPPDEVGSDPNVVVHGFLDKHHLDDAKALGNLLRSASFLVVPSRQEAYGLVFAEAAAYGLPVLATNTGGIPSVVEDKVTGFLFDRDAPVDAYADRILALCRDLDAYRAMRAAARVRYAEHLTWMAWGQKFATAVRRLGLCKADPIHDGRPLYNAGSTAT